MPDSDQKNNIYQSSNSRLWSVEFEYSELFDRIEGYFDFISSEKTAEIIWDAVRDGAIHHNGRGLFTITANFEVWLDQRSDQHHED